MYRTHCYGSFIRAVSGGVVKVYHGFDVNVAATTLRPAHGSFTLVVSFRGQLFVFGPAV